MNISKGGNIIFSIENVYLYISLEGVTEMHGQLLEHVNAEDITHLHASVQQVHKYLLLRCTDIDGAFSKFKEDKVPMPSICITSTHFYPNNHLNVCYADLQATYDSIRLHTNLR